MEAVKSRNFNPTKVLRREEETTVRYTLWHASFKGYEPVREVSIPGRWSQYHLTKDALQGMLSNWDSVAQWQLRKDTSKEIKDNSYHPAAKGRTKPPSPITAYLSRTVRDEPMRILYHGVGRDTLGVSVLVHGGINTVSIYDPFHPDKNVRKLPDGPFDEIHSHYTLNVVDKVMGRQIIQEIHDRLTTSGRAIISVREDV